MCLLLFCPKSVIELLSQQIINSFFLFGKGLMKRWWNVSYSHSSTVYWHCFIPWCRPMVLFSSVHSSLSNPSPDYHGTDPRWQSTDHRRAGYRLLDDSVQIIRWQSTDRWRAGYRSQERQMKSRNCSGWLREGFRKKLTIPAILKNIPRDILKFLKISGACL